MRLHNTHKQIAGSTNAQRVKTNLTIQVENISYDVEAMSLALKVKRDLYCVTFNISIM